MKKLITLFALVLLLTQNAKAQGCVATRSVGMPLFQLPSFHTENHDMSSDKSSSWTFGTNMRYFESFRHFVGKVEQHERLERGTEVINHTLSNDLSFIKTVNNRWSLAFYIPVISNTRSSLYEHGGNTGGPAARNSTRSFGLGDTRFTAYYWIYSPTKHPKFNVQVGAGIKLPTGDYHVQDYFYKLDKTYTIGPVDQSIQLGDGGTGFTIEINGLKPLNNKWSLYSNVYYLINPREQNGVSTARGGIPNTTATQYFTATMSVPDQYMIRGGISYTREKYTISNGLRIEGIPSSDFIGGDKGFRRPGYSLTIEPSIVKSMKKTLFYLSVPVAIERNRTQSYSDKLRTAATGIRVHGDAAFADYLINVGFNIKL